MSFSLTGIPLKAAATLKNAQVVRSQRKLNPIAAQEEELRKLLRKAKDTAFGQAFHFSGILASSDLEASFRQNVPVFDYNKIYHEWWHRSVEGERNVTWPGKIRYFAISSGTSETSGKLIPFTRELSASITRASIRQFVSTVQYHFPAEFYTRGILMIGGSTVLSYHPEGDYYTGYISGISAGRLPSWFECIYKPGQRISRIEDWTERVEAIVEAAPKWDISTLVGIPSWVQVICDLIIERYHLNNIHDIWPNLRAFVHSGMSFDSYEKSFQRIFGREVILVESYLASEGYIAYQTDLNRRVMQLLVDNGLYYEFIPFDDTNFDADGNMVEHPVTLSLSQVKEGVDYALLLSSCAGSWRYLIGDTILFLDTKACDIIITGRTKTFLNQVGEHLSQDDLTRAVDTLARQLDVEIPEFTVAGVRKGKDQGHHWYLGCDSPIDADTALKILDQRLCELSYDYADERRISLPNLFIDVLPTHVFYDFMNEVIGKWGDATKFPRVLKGERYTRWHDYVHATEP